MVIPKDEFARRKKENDFGDLEGGTLYIFNLDASKRYDIDAFFVDAHTNFNEWEDIQAIGSNASGAGLLMPSRHLFAFCQSAH